MKDFSAPFRPSEYSHSKAAYRFRNEKRQEGTVVTWRGQYDTVAEDEGVYQWISFRSLGKVNVRVS